MAVILQTERLLLRELVAEDLDFVATMLADPVVMRFHPKPYDRDGAQKWLDRQIDRYARDGHALWLVAERKTGEPRGQVGLIQQEVDGVVESEIGYLIHRPFWRQGFASEAAAGVKAFAFGQRGLNRVISLIRPENVPSRGVADKLGMAVERETIFHGFIHLVYAAVRNR